MFCSALGDCLIYRANLYISQSRRGEGGGVRHVCIKHAALYNHQTGTQIFWTGGQWPSMHKCIADFHGAVQIIRHTFSNEKPGLLTTCQTVMPSLQLYSMSSCYVQPFNYTVCQAVRSSLQFYSMSNCYVQPFNHTVHTVRLCLAFQLYSMSICYVQPFNYTVCQAVRSSLSIIQYSISSCYIQPFNYSACQAVRSSLSIIQYVKLLCLAFQLFSMSSCYIQPFNYTVCQAVMSSLSITQYVKLLCIVFQLYSMSSCYDVSQIPHFFWYIRPLLPFFPLLSSPSPSPTPLHSQPPSPSYLRI